MLEHSPLISIIIPTFNSGNRLNLALKSIETQTYKNIKVLIMDVLSIDDTLIIAKSFKNKLKQLLIFSAKDRGIYDAMNEGIAKATGEWIYFMGSDDILFEANTLEKIATILSIRKVDLLYGNVYSTRFNGIYDGEFTCSKLTTKNICHQAMFFNRTVFKRIGKFNLKYKSHADWDQKGIVCIDYDKKAEAIGRSCVIKEDNKYRNSQLHGYKIGYAESNDGIQWEKMYKKTNIGLSDSGWDSNMMEYCHVFEHKGIKYMLYNGNDFGKEGFGYAIM